MEKWAPYSPYRPTTVHLRFSPALLAVSSDDTLIWSPFSNKKIKAVIPMEILQTISTLITTVGFPIAAYLLLFHSLRQDIKDLATKLDANTIATTSLVNEIRKGGQS